MYRSHSGFPSVLDIPLAGARYANAFATVLDRIRPSAERVQPACVAAPDVVAHRLNGASGGSSFERPVANICLWEGTSDA